MKPVLFCTSHHSQFARVSDWIKYHSGLLGDRLELLIVNDGPHNGELKEATVISFSESLGRPDLLCVPGWKRSFTTALKYARGRKVAHIESDCFLLPHAIESWLGYVEKEGNYAGWTERYGFMESGFTIFNDILAVDWLVRRFEEFYERCEVERSIYEALEPNIVFRGERIEGNESLFQPYHHYVMQSNIDFVNKVNGMP